MLLSELLNKIKEAENFENELSQLALPEFFEDFTSSSTTMNIKITSKERNL